MANINYNRWISIDDRQPDYDVHVLMTDGIDIWVGYLYKTACSWDYDSFPKDEYSVLGSFKYWCHLPNTPIITSIIKENGEH